jgi:hypothetical protein
VNEEECPVEPARGRGAIDVPRTRTRTCRGAPLVISHGHSRKRDHAPCFTRRSADGRRPAQSEHLCSSIGIEHSLMSVPVWLTAESLS